MIDFVGISYNIFLIISDERESRLAILFLYLIRYIKIFTIFFRVSYLFSLLMFSHKVQYIKIFSLFIKFIISLKSFNTKKKKNTHQNN